MKPVPQAIIAAAGSFLAVTLIFFLIALFCRVSKHWKRQTSTRARIQTRTTPNPNPSSVFDSVTFDPSLKRISLPDLVAATRNFSADGIIGDGSFGFVYKAQLPAGPTVAVKKLDRDAFQGFREFRAEVETLGKLKHENLVKILGYCISGVDRLIIYEFVEFGSLDHWLHDTLPPETRPLTWPARVKIVRGVATGLEFLHTCEPRIIHRDIKASNVLLDADFVAHISDFGLARKVSDSLSHVSTQVAGTVGYMPPEYREGMTSATVKADVYSFGVLMLEVGSGRRPNWPVGVEGGKEVGLTVWARKLFEEERWMEVIDRTVEIKEEREVKEFVKIACLCTNERPKDRPDMKEVVALFNGL